MKTIRNIFGIILLIAIIAAIPISSCRPYQMWAWSLFDKDVSLYYNDSKLGKIYQMESPRLSLSKDARVFLYNWKGNTIFWGAYAFNDSEKVKYIDEIKNNPSTEDFNISTIAVGDDSIEFVRRFDKATEYLTTIAFVRWKIGLRRTKMLMNIYGKDYSIEDARRLSLILTKRPETEYKILPPTN